MRYAYGNKYGETHGFSKTKLYKIWLNMKSRCYNKTATRYERYGGRGIFVCDEWKNNFMNFYNWACNNGYIEGLSIERIDINDGYYPQNCKWITKSEQSKNTCRTHLITYNHETKCVEDWCKELGLKSNTILERAKNLNGDFYKALFEYVPYQKDEKSFVFTDTNIQKKTVDIQVKDIGIANNAKKIIEKNIIKQGEKNGNVKSSANIDSP